MEIHGREGPNAASQAFISAHLPCYKQWARKHKAIHSYIIESGFMDNPLIPTIAQIRLTCRQEAQCFEIRG